MTDPSPPARREKPKIVFFDTVVTLAQVVGVRYFIPGCLPDSGDGGADAWDDV